MKSELFGHKRGSFTGAVDSATHKNLPELVAQGLFR